MNVDLGFWVSVAGGALTIVFGAWSLYLSIRFRYAGRISVVVESSIPLYKSIVKGVPGMLLSYRGAPVEPGLFLLKVAILNDGGIDILKGMVDEPLRLVMPPGVEWLDAKISGTSPGVNASVRVEPSGVTFEARLLRRGECIRVDLIAAASDTAMGASWIDDPIEKLISVSHRIANTGKVVVRKLPPESETRHQTVLGLVAGVVGTLCLAILGTMLYAGRVPAVLDYSVLTPSGVRWVHAYRNGPGVIMLREVGGPFRDQMALDEFVRRIRAVRRSPRGWEQLFWVYLAGMVLVPLPLWLRHRRRTNQWRQIRSATTIPPSDAIERLTPRGNIVDA